jgi:hypothetical protein
MEPDPVEKLRSDRLVDLAGRSSRGKTITRRDLNARVVGARSSGPAAGDLGSRLCSLNLMSDEIRVHVADSLSEDDLAAIERLLPQL